MSAGTGRQNSVLEITVSFLGIHKWEPEIYISDSQRPFICSVVVKMLNFAREIAGRLE
jgi:hypothetical protein